MRLGSSAFRVVTWGSHNCRDVAKLGAPFLIFERFRESTQRIALPLQATPSGFRLAQPSGFGLTQTHPASS